MPLKGLELGTSDQASQAMAAEPRDLVFASRKYWGGIPCLGKSESTNSGATKPVPSLTHERTKVAVISWRAFVGHQPALLSAPHCMPQEHHK